MIMHTFHTLNVAITHKVIYTLSITKTGIMFLYTNGYHNYRISAGTAAQTRLGDLHELNDNNNKNKNNNTKDNLYGECHCDCSQCESSLSSSIVNAGTSTRRPASADRTACRQFQATGQPVSRTQVSDAMTSRLPR